MDQRGAFPVGDGLLLEIFLIVLKTSLRIAFHFAYGNHILRHGPQPGGIVALGHRVYAAAIHPSARVHRRLQPVPLVIHRADRAVACKTVIGIHPVHLVWRIIPLQGCHHVQLGKIRLPHLLRGQLQLLQGNRVRFPSILRQRKHPQKIRARREIPLDHALARFSLREAKACKAAVQKLRAVLAAAVIALHGDGNIRCPLQGKAVILLLKSIRQHVGKAAGKADKAGVAALQSRLCGLSRRTSGCIWLSPGSICRSPRVRPCKRSILGSQRADQKRSEPGFHPFCVHRSPLKKNSSLPIIMNRGALFNQNYPAGREFELEMI